MSARSELTAGLRQLADWLEANPAAPWQYGDKLTINIPLNVNADVEAFAARHDLAVAYDEEGNASTTMRFGAVSYYAYGYVDFDAHTERRAEENARRWASKHGMRLFPDDQGDADEAGDLS